MEETRIVVKATKEEALENIQNIIESYKPEEESLFVIKISGSLENTATQSASNLYASHLIAFDKDVELLVERTLTSLAEINPLKAALLAALIAEQKNS